MIQLECGLINWFFYCEFGQDFSSEYIDVMSERGSEKSEDSDSESPPSPPEVDDSPLQKCMDYNKQCKQ